MTAFDNWEGWRLVALEEVLDCLRFLQTGEFESCNDFCDRLTSAAALLRQTTAEPDPAEEALLGAHFRSPYAEKLTEEERDATLPP